MAMNYDERDQEVTFEIVEEIGIISSSSTGWTKELNVVAWNGGQGKYDIREWSPHHDRMSKGITLNEQEMRMVVDLLKRRSRFVPRGVSVPQGSRETTRQEGSPTGDYSGLSGAAGASSQRSAAPRPDDDDEWERVSDEAEFPLDEELPGEDHAAEEELEELAS